MAAEAGSAPETVELIAGDGPAFPTLKRLRPRLNDRA